MRNIVRDLSISMLVLAFVLTGCGSKATPTATEVPPTNTPAPPPPTEPPAATPAPAVEATHEPTAEATHEAEESEQLENPFTGDPEAIATGKVIYENNCAVCHGSTGMGDGPAAAGLPEEPAKFADCEWQSHEPDGELFHAIVNGRVDDGMPAWGETLTEDQIWQVLAYERSFCPNLEMEATPEPTTEATHEPTAEATHEAHEEHHEEGDTHSPEEHMAGHHDVPEDATAVENPIPATEESIAEGRRLYAANCALCHGETGQGDGPAAASLERPPANLHEDHVRGNSDGALFWIISHGRPDTPMPAWDNVLSEEERWNLVNFLRTFELESE